MSLGNTLNKYTIAIFITLITLYPVNKAHLAAGFIKPDK